MTVEQCVVETLQLKDDSLPEERGQFCGNVSSVAHVNVLILLIGIISFLYLDYILSCRNVIFVNKYLKCELNHLLYIKPGAPYNYLCISSIANQFGQCLLEVEETSVRRSIVSRVSQQSGTSRRPVEQV